MKRNIALAGNPNSGKTSLFNELTGANQYVGNWPGVTVERKSGRLREHEDVTLLDLPGIYSLSPYSPEEVVTRRYLLDEKPDLIIDVVDATNLERNLYLTSQLIETGIPVVVALNMMDLVEQKGDRIDVAALSKALGCPVAPISALRQSGLDALVELMTGEIPAAAEPIPFPAPVEEAIAAIRGKFSCTRWEAVKLLSLDELETEGRDDVDMHYLHEMRLKVEKAMGDDIASIIAAGRYDAIGAFMPQALKRGAQKESFSAKLDRVLTHRVAGLLIFVAVMWAIYYISIQTIGDWGTGWANDVVFGPVVGGWLGGFIGDTAASLESMIQLSAILAMCLVFPVTLRRLHDIGRNGSWCYFAIAPFLLEYMCRENLPECLQGGVFTAVMWLLYAVNAALLLLCLLKPGDKGANAYGREPELFRLRPFSLNGRSGRVEYVVGLVVMSAIAYGVAWLGTLTLDCHEQLQALINDGIVAGVGAVLGFLPQMAVLFLLLAILEDCGYMARVAFMMDRIFRSIGLSGKSVIPLLVGMGCGVPAIMATRTIENEKDRRMSVMLTTFVPCGAKLPIIALIAALVGAVGSEDMGANIATIAYFAGFGSVILGGLILRKTHMFAGSYTPFVMELPAYHMPRGANINIRAMERCKAFVRKAGTIIFLSSAIIWFASSYDWHMNFLAGEGEAEEPAAEAPAAEAPAAEPATTEAAAEAAAEPAALAATASDAPEEAEADPIEKSMLADVGHAFAPLFSPLGWGDWRPAVASVTGLVAKEQLVGTCGVLYHYAAEEEDEEYPQTSSLPKTNALTALVMAAWQGNEAVRNFTEEESDAEGAEAPAEGAVAANGEEPAAEEEEEDEDAEAKGVAAQLAASGTFTVASALSFMLFNLLCAPCFAACGAIRREMNSARWTWFAIGYMCVWAYLVAMMTYQFGTWISQGTFATGQMVSCVILIGMLVMLFRRGSAKKDA